MEQLDLTRHVLDSCLLLELEVFIQTIFLLVQSGGQEGREEKHGYKHLLSFYYMSDTLLSALYMIKHLLLTKDPLSSYHSNPSLIYEKIEA